MLMSPQRAQTAPSKGTEDMARTRLSSQQGDGFSRQDSGVVNFENVDMREVTRKKMSSGMLPQVFPPLSQKDITARRTSKVKNASEVVNPRYVPPRWRGIQSAPATTASSKPKLKGQWVDRYKKKQAFNHYMRSPLIPPERAAALARTSLSAK
eukprot:Colp12_sorted_trinity150504_noHs@28928